MISLPQLPTLPLKAFDEFQIMPVVDFIVMIRRINRNTTLENTALGSKLETGINTVCCNAVRSLIGEQNYSIQHPTT